jgi:hypothetical protein
MGPRDGMSAMVKRKFLTILGLELRPLDRLARSQSLYRLRCPDSKLQLNSKLKQIVIKFVSSCCFSDCNRVFL